MQERKWNDVQRVVGTITRIAPLPCPWQLNGAQRKRVSRIPIANGIHGAEERVEGEEAVGDV